MKQIIGILWVISTFIFACAKMGLPPGGPEDKTPPFIVRTIPVNGATRVDPRTTIQVGFSEGIQPSSAKGAIFITPYPGEGVKIRYGRRKIKIAFSQPLKLERTYVITFGTGIKDDRNNPMKASFTLAFSTGAVLDEGEISGRVYGAESGSGIDIWAYELSYSLDPNPLQREPDYIVQCATAGDFKFSHLAIRAYRLFAIRDKASDRLYQIGEDEIGVAFRDVYLTTEKEQKADSMYFQMTRTDTLGPSLLRAVPSDRHHLTLRFDKSLSSRYPLSTDFFTVVSTQDSLDTLVVEHAYLDPVNPQTIHVFTHAQTPGIQYKVTVRDLNDESGNPIEPATREALFDGADVDTARPVLLWVSPKPGEKSVALEGRVQLIFNEAIDSVRFPEGFSLKDTAGQAVQGSIRWDTPLEVLFQSKELLKSRQTYEIQLLGKGVVDRAGNALADTLFRFQTLDGDTLSEIAGRVWDPDSTAAGSIHIHARQTGESKVVYTLVISEPGDYRFKDILPGLYLLDCFRDRDGDGRYSFGKPFPFVPSERFVVSNDTVKVRSRWPNEGNDLRLPRTVF